jgi:hypothetical protein
MTDQVFGSVNEENVFRALNALKIPFAYQYEILGGRSRAGGYVLDFLADVAPQPVPIQVQGAYWHGGSMSPYEPFEIAQIQEYAKLAGWGMPVLLEENETATYEAAYYAIREKVGVG